MMDINYELYKVFYHVATTLNFSVCCKPVDQDTGAETGSDTLYQKHQKSPAYPGR